MKRKTYVTCRLWVLLGIIFYSVSPALTHSFKVVLVVPSSGSQFEAAKQIREGFMVATAERDSHPDQESDGHLGGLDVYVTIVDESGDVPTKLEQAITEHEPDIIVAFNSQDRPFLFNEIVRRQNVPFLVSNRSPDLASGRPSIVRFSSAYTERFGGTPSSYALSGYVAARRIDVAVRAQGGVEDKKAIMRNFKNTKKNFE